MNIVRCFVIFMMLAFATVANAQEVLVGRAPEYPAGEGRVFSIDTLLGIADISVVSRGLVEKHSVSWWQFDAKVTVGSMTLFDGPAFMRQGTWDGHLVYDGTMYRAVSNIKFPLRVGDIFSNTVYRHQACRSPEYRGYRCMEVDVVENCHGLRRTQQGIEYVCDDGKSGRIRYVMDGHFRWLVSFEVLN